MRRFTIILFAWILFIPVSSFSQEAETLFSGDVDHGGFGGLIYGVTSVNGEAAYLRGSRGAWVIRFQDGHALHIGLGGYRTSSSFNAVNWSISSIEPPEMRTSYGGFELEYVNKSHELIHLGVQALIGSGNVKYRNSDVDLTKTSDNYFVLQPGVNIHLNVTRWFRMSGGLFYRHAGGVNLQGTGNSDLSGASGLVNLKFGKF